MSHLYAIFLIREVYSIKLEQSDLKFSQIRSHFWVYQNIFFIQDTKYSFLKSCYYDLAWDRRIQLTPKNIQSKNSHKNFSLTPLSFTTTCSNYFYLYITICYYYSFVYPLACGCCSLTFSRYVAAMGLCYY